MGATELENGEIVTFTEGYKSHDYFLRFWSLDGNLLRTVKAHTSGIYSVQKLSNNRIVSLSSDGTIRIFHTKKTIYRKIDHKYAIKRLYIFPEGFVISISWDNYMIAWNEHAEKVYEGTLDNERILIVDLITNFFNKLGFFFSGKDNCVLTEWGYGVGENFYSMDRMTRRNVAIKLRSSDILSFTDDTKIGLFNNQMELKNQLDNDCRSVKGFVELSNGNIIFYSNDSTLILLNEKGMSYEEMKEERAFGK